MHAHVLEKKKEYACVRPGEKKRMHALTYLQLKPADTCFMPRASENKAPGSFLHPLSCFSLSPHYLWTLVPLSLSSSGLARRSDWERGGRPLVYVCYGLVSLFPNGV
jgi:hypothetical protein